MAIADAPAPTNAGVLGITLIIPTSFLINSLICSIFIPAAIEIKVCCSVIIEPISSKTPSITWGFTAIKIYIASRTSSVLSLAILTLNSRERELSNSLLRS